MRRTSQFLRDNLGPTCLTAGATLTAVTAPPDPIAGPLVRAGGIGLVCAGLCLYVLKNSSEQSIKLKTVASLLSGISGLSACFTLGGNGFYQMVQSKGDANWLAFGAFIFAANVGPYFFGNGGVTVDGIRRLSKRGEKCPPTDWNGISINYALGGLGLFLAGVSVYAANPEVGRNLMTIGALFTSSGLTGLSLKTKPKTIQEAAISTADAAKQAARIIAPLRP